MLAQYLQTIGYYIGFSVKALLMCRLILYGLNFLIIIISIVSVSNYAFSIEPNLPILHDENLKIETVYEGLRFPTNMAFLGPNDILVLEKNEGNVQRIINGTILSEPLLHVKVSPTGERGMLGIAIENNKSESEYPIVFLYYTKPEKGPNGERYLASNSVYRFELINNKLVKPKILVHLPTLYYDIHNGGVLLIGPDNNLYLMVGSGEGDVPSEPYSTISKTQNYRSGLDPDRRGGILGVTQNGHPINKEGILGDSIPLNLYFAYGIRNSFGMDFDPLTGKLWDTENGPFNGDEINLVAPGFNSGWQKVMGLSSLHKGFSKSELETFGGKGHYSDPEFAWNRSVGVTALKFLNSDKLGKQYENDMFVGDFHNGFLYHFDLDTNRKALSLTGKLQDKIANEKGELKDIIFARGFGGITDIKVGSDGYLYILSLQEGGNNCSKAKPLDCVKYDSGIVGTIYRIVPK
jgi:glucose/arabinose dehydrogenase